MVQKRSIWFIFNPVSGKSGNKEHVLKEVIRLLDLSIFDYRIERTQYKGHAAVLATMACENNADVVVAIGGDGTVNEVARSLTDTDVVLGIIPCGSGNGLARHLQVPMDVPGAVQIINDMSVKKLDYGKINRYPFFCTCGMGFDAMVSFKFAASIKRGVLTYMEQTLKEITRYKPETYIIEDEHHKIAYKAFMITCANASQYGNNAYIAPEASMSDGLLNVTVVEPFTAIEAPQLAYQLFNGTLTDGGKIKMFKARKMSITRERKGVIHCDGEPYQAGKVIDVEIFPKRLNVLVNKRNEGRSLSIIQTINEAFNYVVANRKLGKIPFKK